nr:uncharacterized protein LOC115267597 [Aedes albopictus]
MEEEIDREANVEVEDEQSASTETILYITQEELNRLIAQRNHAMSRVQNIVNNISAFQGDVFSLETRREMLKDGYRNYDQHQTMLEQILPDEIQSRDETEMRYIAGLSSFEKLIKSMKTENASNAGRDSVRLPMVDLPVFSGAGESWLEWFDKFNALIHSRASLATIQKFEYLKLSLRGAALGLIDSLPTTDANYEVAYDMLVRRYNNPKLLIQKHTRELFELKAVETESASGLRNLFDGAQKHLRCLLSLNQPVESWDAILIHLSMSNKLDPLTRREWEAASSGSVPPSYSMLENFVSDRCQMLDAIPLKRKSYSETFPPAKRIKQEGRALTITKPPQTCAVCRGEHFVGSCNRYRAKSLEEKHKMVKRLSLCFNCLKSNHTAAECRSRGCLKCDGKHHTSIHRERKGETHYDGKKADQDQPQIATTYQSTQEAILPTASVRVNTNDRAPILCRALLDSGSQFNFATKSLLNLLGVSTDATRVNVQGFGQCGQAIHERAMICITSRVSSYRRTVPVLVTETITGCVPPKDINTDQWNLSDIDLADPSFHQI